MPTPKLDGSYRRPAPAQTVAERPRYLTPRQISRMLGPVGRNNSYIHVNTIISQIVKGVGLRGGGRAHLEAIRAPGGWLVTPEALEDFLATVTADRLGRPLPSGAEGVGHATPAARSPARRLRDVAAAEAEVVQMGA